MKQFQTKYDLDIPDRCDYSAEWIARPEDEILVTGASGFIGVRVVRQLLEYGFKRVRCFVRPSRLVNSLNALAGQFPSCAIEFVAGDLVAPDDCFPAIKEASIVYHLAAGNEKSFAGAFMNSALATRNLMDAFLEFGKPKRFVNVSSFAVYSALKLKAGDLLDETCPLEDSSQERFDAYGFGKLKQEELVRDYGHRYNLPYVIVRPGVVFGPGKRELSGRVGIDTFGFFLQVNGSNRLPLTFVDNCAEAIVLAGLKPGIDGETFNIVDDDLPSSSQFLKACKKAKAFRSVRIPYSIAYAMSIGWERYSKWSKGQLPPAFNHRRCAAEWKRQRFSNQKLKERLDWKPRVSMQQAMDAFLGQFQSNGG